MVAIFLRSLVYNLLFYSLLVFWIVVGIPTFLMPGQAILNVGKCWARSSIWLMRVDLQHKGGISRTGKNPARPADRRIETSIDVGNLRAAAIFRTAAVHRQARAEVDSVLRLVPDRS